MAQDLRILSATRSYEFPVDAIRLSVFNGPLAIQAVTDAFGFRQGGPIPAPAARFGPTFTTFPPAVEFQLGTCQPSSSESQAVHVRFLTIEQRRVVISVAAPSSALDHVWTQFRAAVSTFSSPDGSPALGEASGVIDHSEVSGRLDFAPEDLLAGPLWNALRGAARRVDASHGLIPAFHGSLVSPAEEYPGDQRADRGGNLMWTLALRAGSLPSRRLYYSSAPLDSSAHTRLLRQIERGLVKAANAE